MAWLLRNKGFAVPDVIGHEYAHSISNSLLWNGSSFTKIKSFGESGAISEAYSDFFGEVFEQHETGTKDWKSGTNSLRLARDLANPPSILDDGLLLTPPDRYLSPDFYTGTGDRSGVHINAGVPNKASFLASEGGAFNGYNITGIGIEKVEQIWYRAVTEYFPKHPAAGNTIIVSFNMAYNDLLQAASDLYGDEEVLQMYLALRAVEMNLSRSLSLTPPLGDYNQDGVVDMLDSDLWTATQGESIFASPSTADMRADGNHDGIIDIADFDYWQAHLPSQAQASVPEPSSWVLLLASITGFLAFGRTNRQHS